MITDYGDRQQADGACFSAMAAPSIDAQRLAQFASAETLGTAICDASGLPFADVWQSLCHVPENMLALLDSARGWSVVAGFVAHDCGHNLPDYAPTVH